MLDKLKDTFLQASEVIKEQTSNLSESAKEKYQQLIDDWLKVFRLLEECGMKITSFGLGYSISPSLEVELEGNADDFSTEKIKKLIENNKESSSLNSVFKAIKTTYELHEKISSQRYEKVLVKVTVKITPEIKVVLGEPKLF